MSFSQVDLSMSALRLFHERPFSFALNYVSPFLTE